MKIAHDRTSATYTRRKHIGVCILIALSLMLLSIPQTVIAAESDDDPELDLQVDPKDKPLVIHDMLDDNTTSFSGNVRLTVTGGDAEELTLLADDLQQAEDENVKIDRTHVTIDAGISLSENQPRDVRVTINNVIRPGNYSGDLKFLLPGQAVTEALVVPLELHIDAQPTVEPVTQNLSFQVVHCRNLGCTLAKWLLPETVASDERLILFDNKTLTPVEVTGAAVVLRGDKTGEALKSNDVQLAVPHTLPATQVDDIDVTLHRNRIPPDRYQGTLRFKLENADDPVNVNVDLDVRDGPIGVLIIAIIGIIVGRLLQHMETPETKMQMRLTDRWVKLKREARDVTDLDAKSHLVVRFQTIKEKIDAAEDTEQVLDQELDKLEASIDFFISLETLEQTLEKPEFADLKTELLPIIDSARQALMNEKSAEAERLRKEVDTRIKKAQQDGEIDRWA